MGVGNTPTPFNNRWFNNLAKNKNRNRNRHKRANRRKKKEPVTEDQNIQSENQMAARKVPDEKAPDGKLPEKTGSSGVAKLGLIIAFLGIFLNGLTWWWTNVRERERFLFKPLEVFIEEGTSDDKFSVGIDFAVNNLGTHSAILSELCLVRSPGIKAGTPDDVAAIASTARYGSIWRREHEGRSHKPVLVESGGLVNGTAYFQLYKRGPQKKKLPLEIYAVVLDRHGVERVARHTDWLILKETREMFSGDSKTVELLPSPVLAHGGFSDVGPSGCTFFGTFPEDIEKLETTKPEPGQVPNT